MNYKVIESFIDKETGNGFNAGSTFSTEDVGRASFLIQKGFLKGEAPKIQIDEALLTEAKALKVKGYTKMDEDSLRKAIDAIKVKKVSE